MSLTASMWTSVSGLLAHGEKMNVIGNNISNVNTVGYRSQRMDFQDFVYQYIGTAAGMGQIGRGTSIGIVMNDFSQGSLETTTSSTDIAIQGNGFFSVKPLTNNMKYYTRAGNFTFNKDGYLVDPHGYALQGWKIDRDVAAQNASTSRTGTGIIGTGSPVDICLDTFTCPPRHTTQVTMPVNLKYDKIASVEDHSSDPTNANPFFSLIQNWDATQEPPLGQNLRSYQTTIEVYDEGGRQHKLTVYFDRVSGSSDPTDPNYINGYTDSESYWEYIVTMDPGDDVRDFNSVFDPTGLSPTTPSVPENLKGLLAAGSITFSSSGAMKDMSCFVPDKDAGNNLWYTITDPVNNLGAINLAGFVAAPINSDGYPLIAPNFSGTAGLQNAYNPTYTQPNSNADDRLIALDFGISSKNNTWAFLGTYDPGPPPIYTPPAHNGAGGLVSAADMGNNKYNVNGLDGQAQVDPTYSTTCLGDNFYEHNGFRQDGYTYGDLRYVSVSTDGVLSAAYSNGVTLQLYQIVLYDFPSNQNLRREGGNLFTETRESGVPSSGAAGTGTFGTTHGSSLEQSNADLSREFVNMITTQRGFQANSKTITTVDTMLETVIQMKR